MRRVGVLVGTLPVDCRSEICCPCCLEWHVISVLLLFQK